MRRSASTPAFGEPRDFYTARQNIAFFLCVSTLVFQSSISLSYLLVVAQGIAVSKTCKHR